MIEKVPYVGVPVFLTVGENDYNTPLETLMEYYRELDAPKGKEVYVIIEAAHLLFLKDPYYFHEILSGIKQSLEYD